MEAGYKGEKSIEFSLNYVQGEHFILHDLRLYDGQHFFQIDTLLLTAHLLLVIEVKNYAGVLTFDRRFNQLIRMKNGIEEGFPDPIDQVDRQVELLKKWMKQNVGQYIPIEGFVVFANERAVIKTFDKHDEIIKEKVARKHSLPAFIKAFAVKYPKQYVEIAYLKRIALKLLDQHVELNTDLISQYDVKRSDILTGVQCPQCHTLPMKRLHGKWHCPSCSTNCRVSHHQALQDYAHLISPSISNQQAREFLHIDSRHVMKRLLKQYSLEGLFYKLR